MKKQITLKHDIAANWAKAVNFIPKLDELILYDGILENGVYIELPRLKRGDGITKLNDLPFIETASSSNEINYLYYDETLELLGVVDLDNPSAISIYAKDFHAKEEIAALVDLYNSTASEENQISYTDYVALVMSGVSTIIDAISYILIGLVVSSIMIGIITYISVLERTKEIGILRAVGASKRDVSRVFTAETIIEGFAAGAIGIGVTLVLIMILNAILYSLSGLPSLKAILPAKAGVVLVIISVLLTLIAGFFPSRLAAKKDPVEALRTE